MKRVPCPRCAGSPYLTEAGDLSACYLCYSTGEVSEAAANEDRAADSWARYIAAEARLRSKLVWVTYDDDLPF